MSYLNFVELAKLCKDFQREKTLKPLTNLVGTSKQLQLYLQTIMQSLIYIYFNMTMYYKTNGTVIFLTYKSCTL